MGHGQLGDFVRTKKPRLCGCWSRDTSFRGRTSLLVWLGISTGSCFSGLQSREVVRIEFHAAPLFSCHDLHGVSYHTISKSPCKVPRAQKKPDKEVSVPRLRWHERMFQATRYLMKGRKSLERSQPTCFAVLPRASPRWERKQASRIGWSISLLGVLFIRSASWEFRKS